MPEEVPTTYLEVEFENDPETGKRKVKKLPDGTDPISAYGHMLIEMDREYRETHNGWPLLHLTVSKQKDMHGEPDHHVLTVYSQETGKQKPVSRVIIIDKATGKPAPVLEPSHPKYIPKASSAVHIEQMLTHDRLKEEAKKRGLQIKSESIKRLDKVLEELEG